MTPLAPRAQGTKIAVLGCGTIGASWAALFAASGHEVRVWDPIEGSRAPFETRLSVCMTHLSELGFQAPGPVIWEQELPAALQQANWIHENAPENLATKHDLLERLVSLIDDNAIIASSTSSFTWSQLAAGRAHPKRLIVCHPFNPPHLIPLVELYAPSKDVVDQSIAIMKSLRRVPVVLKREAVGHIANRLASALWREAVNIVAEGIADVADVDQALIQGPALRWSVLGTHMGYHLGGGPGGIRSYLQHLGPSQERRWKDLGSPDLNDEACERLIAGVVAESKGRSVSELEALRDRALIGLLRARQGMPEIIAPQD